MQVSILGPVEVRIDGDVVPVGGSRIRTLLTRLALAGGSPVSASELVDAVWDGDAPVDQLNALQSLISRLRRALGGASRVTQEPAGYRLAVKPEDVDAHRFRELTKAGRRHLQDGDPTSATRLLYEALALWRGPALAELTGSLGSAAELEEGRVAALEDRIDADLQLGRAADVIGELEAIVAAHPLRERPAALLIDSLDADGRPGAALQAYERVRRALADQLGADPSAALQARHAALLGAAPPDRPTAGTRLKTNLRAQLTSFMGRETEMDRIRELLRVARLVTLIGPGGAGKTRLAAEAAARMLPQVPDGVWLVELAPVTDPIDLAQAVVGSLGVRSTAHLDGRQTSRRDAFERLVDALTDKQAILLLDNCEHLIDAAADLCDRLLSHCPQLRILATSREPLSITGEALCAVPPLRHDTSGGGVAEALTLPAVQLFVDRAQAVHPGFCLDDMSVQPVLEICRRLDGLPLAIELAAARTRTMAIEQIADRLDDRFRLLTGGSRTALPRHRTLQAVVDWSWELLTEPERDLAERLAVFPAGATPESASAALAVPAPADDLLAALVDKSLLQFVGGRSPRYRMLETIREYGTDRLVERELLTEARDRHAAYFLDLARRAESKLRGREQLIWIERVDAERDNFYAALTHFCDLQNAEGAINLTSSLSWFLTMRGDHDVARSWLALALSVPGGKPSARRAAASGAYAMNMMIVVGMDEGMKMLAEVDEELQPYLGTDSLPEIVMMGIVSALFTGNDKVAATRVELGMQNSDPWVRAAAQLMRAVFADNAGDVQAMREGVEQALTRAQDVGDRFLLSSALEVQSRLSLLDGNLPGAIAALEESADLADEFGNHDDAVRSRGMAGGYYFRLGDIPEAQRRIEAARDRIDELGSVHGMIFVGGLSAQIARLTGDEAAAFEHAQEGLRRAREMSTGGPPQVIAMALTEWAAVCITASGEHHDLDAASGALSEALDNALRAKDMPVTAEVTIVLALLREAEGEHSTAASLLGIADRLRGSPDPTQPDASRLATELSAALGPNGFAAARENGLVLGRDEAVERLRSEIQRQ
ncbi:MAG: BTAD domain-containing putative transcriptional regulator [Jatrophihabitans sp.]